MKVLIMAGGTGGHVIPALSIARLLQARGADILWLGARGRMEEQLVPKAGFKIAYIKVQGLRRNGLKSLMGAPWMIMRAIWQARKVIKDFAPDVVIGMGGYASGPGGVAAKMLGIPLVLHEQNAAAGLTNRLLFKIANLVLLGFPGAFSGPKVQVTGNPVRPEIAALHALNREFLAADTLHLLIVGGSLGAQALNEKLPALLSDFYIKKVKPTGLSLHIVHQCGKGNQAKVAACYAQQSTATEEGFGVITQDFIDDMAAQYRSADVVICRAGALTVAEVAAAGLPALYIPLPTAVDDHQTKNAAVQVSLGGAAMIAQANLNATTLQASLSPLLEQGELAKRADCQRQAAVLDAPQRVLQAIDALLAAYGKKVN